MLEFMKANPSLTLDIILIIVLFIYSIRGYLNGLLASVAELAGNLGSLIAAAFASNAWAPRLFKGALRKSLVERSYNYLAQASRQVDIQTAVTDVAGGLPRFLVENILGKAQETLSTILRPTQESAAYLVDEFLRPIITPCISVVIFVLVFRAVKIVCGILSKFLKKINDVPILGTANKWTGFVIGIVIGGINIILLSFLLSIIILGTGDSLTYLNSAVMSGSKIMAITGLINPFLP